jgi:DNA-directed RNA polymerase subunit K/omega
MPPKSKNAAKPKPSKKPRKPVDSDDDSGSDSAFDEVDSDDEIKSKVAFLVKKKALKGGDYMTDENEFVNEDDHDHRMDDDAEEDVNEEEDLERDDGEVNAEQEDVVGDSGDESEADTIDLADKEDEAMEDQEVEELYDEETGEYAGESKVCVYKDLNNDNIIYDDGDDPNEYSRLEPMEIPTESRITGKRMSFYEMVRVVGTRAQHLKLGAPKLIDNVETLDPLRIAALELKNKVIPYTIKRNLPNKKYELWHIYEMEIPYELNADSFH